MPRNQDLLGDPQPAQGNQILAIPTLVRKLPEPLRKIDAISDSICLWDRMGRPLADLLCRSCPEDLFFPGAAPDHYMVSARCQSQRRESQTVLGHDRWLQVSADPIFNNDGEVSGAMQIVADLTERQQAQNRINDLNILLKAIAEISEGLLRVNTEPELFKNTCISLTRVPKIRFAWIGLVQPETYTLKVVAHAGHEEGYLATMRVTWDDTEWGQGPSGEAIRTRTPVIIADMETDPRSAPWRTEARRRGYRSNVSLPLVHQNDIIGVLKVYSGDSNAFGERELGFLVQVAGDIAVGVKSLRLEQELSVSLHQLQKVLHQTVEAIGTIAELRDPFTAGHQRRVTKLACALAEAMGLEENRIEGVRIAGSLHDLGKIFIPAEILSRPGKLNPHEMTIIRAHAGDGYEILKKIDFP